MVPGRKLATTTLVGAGAAVGGAVGLLLGEQAMARRAIGVTDDLPPSADGTYGEQDLTRTIRCALFGDSAIVGYGMSEAATTPTALIGESLSHILDATVEIRCYGVVGAETTGLDAQIDKALADDPPDVAVIVIGANDVTHRVPRHTSATALRAAVARLLDAGAEVVAGTCPDLSRVRPIPQPLRSVAGLISQRLAKAQMMAIVEAGGRAVSLGGLLGPVFAQQADVMFGTDHFHPSAVGYANMVNVLVPSIAAAIDERDRGARAGAMADAIMPLEEAADQALAEAGTEVTAVGADAGILRRR
jgi:lysophospholipase L1-like esterase